MRLLRSMLIVTLLLRGFVCAEENPFKLRTTVRDTEPFRYVDFSPDDTWVYTVAHANGSYSIKLYDLETAKPVAMFSDRDPRFLRLQFTPSETYIRLQFGVRTDYGDIHRREELWRVSPKERLIDPAIKPERLLLYMFSPKDRFAVTDKTTELPQRLVKLPTFDVVVKLDKFGDRIEAESFSGDEKWLVVRTGKVVNGFVINDQSELVLVSTESGEAVRKIGTPGLNRYAKFSIDSRLLLYFDFDAGTAELSEVDSGKKLREFKTYYNTFFTPDGNYLVTMKRGAGNVDGEISRWPLNSNEPPQVCTIPKIWGIDSFAGDHLLLNDPLGAMDMKTGKQLWFAAGKRDGHWSSDGQFATQSYGASPILNAWTGPIVFAFDPLPAETYRDVQFAKRHRDFATFLWREIDRQNTEATEFQLWRWR